MEEKTSAFGHLEGPVRVREICLRVAFDGRIFMRSADAEVCRGCSSLFFFFFF